MKSCSNNSFDQTSKNRDGSRKETAGCTSHPNTISVRRKSALINPQITSVASIAKRRKTMCIDTPNLPMKKSNKLTAFSLPSIFPTDYIEKTVPTLVALSNDSRIGHRLDTAEGSHISYIKGKVERDSLVLKSKDWLKKSSSLPSVSHQEGRSSMFRAESPLQRSTSLSRRKVSFTHRSDSSSRDLDSSSHRRDSSPNRCAPSAKRIKRIESQRLSSCSESLTTQKENSRTDHSYSKSMVNVNPRFQPLVSLRHLKVELSKSLERKLIVSDDSYTVYGIDGKFEIKNKKKDRRSSQCKKQQIRESVSETNDEAVVAHITTRDFSQQIVSRAFTRNVSVQKIDEESMEKVNTQENTIKFLKQLIKKYDSAARDQQQTIADLHRMISERENKVAERERMITERERMITERDQMIAERDLKIADQKQQITEYQEIIRMQETNFQFMTQSKENLSKLLKQQDLKLAHFTRNKSAPAVEANTTTTTPLPLRVRPIHELRGVPANSQRFPFESFSGTPNSIEYSTTVRDPCQSSTPPSYSQSTQYSQTVTPSSVNGGNPTNPTGRISIAYATTVHNPCQSSTPPSYSQPTQNSQTVINGGNPIAKNSISSIERFSGAPNSNGYVTTVHKPYESSTSPSCSQSTQHLQIVAPSSYIYKQNVQHTTQPTRSPGNTYKAPPTLTETSTTTTNINPHQNLPRIVQRSVSERVVLQRPLNQVNSAAQNVSFDRISGFTQEGPFQTHAGSQIRNRAQSCYYGSRPILQQQPHQVLPPRNAFLPRQAFLPHRPFLPLQVKQAQQTVQQSPAQSSDMGLGGMQK